jgi:PAS domain S-box-containing protein
MSTVSMTCPLRIVVLGDATICGRLRPLLDPRHRVVEADAKLAAALMTGSDPEIASCVVLIHEQLVLDGARLLANPAVRRLFRECAVVVLVEGADARRAALRAGASACLEIESLSPDNVARALEDALDRFAGLASGPAPSEPTPLIDDVHERTERLTRRVLDSLFVFVGLLEVDGTLLETNEAPLAASGVAIDEVRGKKFWDCPWWSYSPAVQAQLRDACERAAKGETVRYDVPVRISVDGRMVIDFQVAPLRDPSGHITHLLPSAVDVTHRVTVEQELRRSEERLRIAKDAAGLGIHDFDVKTGTIRWDQRVREIWGVEGPITYEVFIAGVHPDDRAAVQAAVDHATDPRGDGVYLVEYRVIHRHDGRTRWVAVTGQTAFEDGRPIRLIGTVQDITARKQADEALRRSQEQLRESDRRKDEFLAMLGHELRNPLAAIRSASELLHLFAGTDARLARLGEVLERQSNHMVRLIDGLLEVSRIARGKIHLERKDLDLREVLTGVLHDRHAQLRDSGVVVDLRLPERPLWVWGDEVRLVQIFDNLLNNAIKFTPPSGSIRIAARQSDDSVLVSITDTGIGIRADMLETIFEPFQQDTQEIARVAGGLGIGLALVRGLLELHQGSVVARSPGPGGGSEFEVRLPASTPTQAVSAQESASQSAPRRVLIVEDNHDAAQMLRGLLELRGHTVVVAGSGPEAMALLRGQPTDVILCDIGLPGLDGYELARLIRGDPQLRAVLLVALTGYGQPEDRRRAAEAGFDEHLVKPVSLDALEQVLERV